MRPLLFLGIREDDRAADEEYAAIVRGLGVPAEAVRRVRLERELPDVHLEDWAGIVAGGGPWTLSQPDDLKTDAERRGEVWLAGLLERVIAADHPFLGCCYGLGTLASRGGGLVDGTFAEPIGAVLVEVNEAGEADPLLAGLPPAFQAFVGHKEAVTRVPAGAVVLASSATCPVQVLRIGRHVYATQFHPELDPDGLRTRIEVYAGHGYFDPAETHRLLDHVVRADVRHPGGVLAAFARLCGAA